MEMLETQVGVWEISVAGYGTFRWLGTEVQAEAQRAHKANWESAVARKKRARDATPEEVTSWNLLGPHSIEEDGTALTTKGKARRG